MIWFLNMRLNCCYSPHCLGHAAQLGTPQLLLSYTWDWAGDGGEVDVRRTGYKIMNSGGNAALRIKKPAGTPEDRKARGLWSPALYVLQNILLFPFSLSFFFASCLDNFSFNFSVKILQSFLEISLSRECFWIWIVNSHQKEFYLDIFPHEEYERTWKARAGEQDVDLQFGKCHKVHISSSHPRLSLKK